MICEGSFAFGMPTIVAGSGAATVSPNIYNAGSAKTVFDGAAGPPLKIAGNGTVTSDASDVTMRVQFVGADNTGLTTNPEVLADTGTIQHGPDGSTAIASGTVIPFELKTGRQFSPKQYYGLLVTIGGTNQAMAASSGVANLVIDSQSMDYFRKAATP